MIKQIILLVIVNSVFIQFSAFALMCTDNLESETSKYLRQGDRLTISPMNGAFQIDGNYHGLTTGINLTNDQDGEFVYLTRPDLVYPQNVQVTEPETFIVDSIDENLVRIKHVTSNNTYFLACGNFNGPKEADHSDEIQETIEEPANPDCSLLDLLKNNSRSARLSVSRSGNEITDSELCTKQNAVVPIRAEGLFRHGQGQIQFDI